MIRRETIRRFLVAALLAICAALLVLILYYENLPTSVDVIEDVVMDADIELKTFNYTETVDGVKHWTLTGASAAHDFNQEQTLIDQVRMHLYDQKDVGDVVLTADQGTALLSDQQVDVAGNVVIQSDNGYTLLSERASYYGNRSQSGVIESQAAVTIRSDQLELHGTGLLFDVGLRTMQLNKDVSATFYPESPKEQP
nr:LPS export ABC transporter periplasmic protein LptC [uncultured Desulfuromonas sp.]